MKAVLRSLLLISFLLTTLFVAPARAGDIYLSSAASMRDAVNELVDVYVKKTPGVTFQRNFGASGAVAKQIENGAPADLYISANVQWMDYLKEKKLVDATSISIFAYNEVVFVGEPDLKVASLKDVVNLEKIAIGSPKSVPAGQYAMEALQKAGIEKQLKNKLVMARDVRECLLYADRGEVDGAFVYRTDAVEMAKNVKILFAVPQELYSRVTYPVALTVAGGKKPEVVEFFKFLRTPDAKAILVRHSFVVK